MDPKKRIAALAALGAAVVAIAVVAIGPFGSDPYTVTANVDNASQLIKGNDVRIGAVKVGTITGVSLADDGTAELEMEIDEETAPVQQGTTMAVRSTSLFGLANRYVVLQPPSGPAEPLPDGATVGIEDTTSIVESDVLFDTVDRNTRRGFQQLFQGGATVLAGRAEEANETLKWLGPTFEGSALVLGEIAKDQDAFAGLLNEAATTARAVNSRRAELVELISAANATTAAFGDEQIHLERAIGQLPDTLRRGNTTFVEVREALDEIDPLVATAKPNTRNLAKYLRDEVRPFLNRARPTIPNAAAIVDKKGKNNDFTDFMRNMPALSRTASTALPSAIDFMNDSEPTIDLFRAYTPDIFAAIGNLGDVTSHYDANGHYARGIPILGAAQYNLGLNEIIPWDGTNRLAGFELGTGARCPGGAMQPPADGSAPVAVPGCNPALTPPGP